MFIEQIADELNVKANRIKIPLTLAKMYSSIVEIPFRLFGLDPILTKSRIDFFTKTRSFDTKKAHKMLDYKTTKLEEGIKNTILWYRKNKML